MRLDLNNLIIIDSKVNKQELNIILLGKYENMSTNLSMAEIIDLNNFLSNYIKSARKSFKKLTALKGGKK